MFPEERRRKLVAHARQHGRLDVSVVSAELDAAPETIRRDLNVLEARGLLRRVHGGAMPIERVGFEGELASREAIMLAEKKRIAAAAVHQLEDAESIYLDEGSTTQLLATVLPPGRRLTVVTSALQIASALAEQPHIDLLLLGGRVRSNTLGTVDHWATRMLNDLVIDLAFLGTNGVSTAHGLTTPDPAVAAVKAAAAASARRRVLVADHTKFGVDSFCRSIRAEDLDAIVTDTGLTSSAATEYEELGVTVLRA